MEGPYAILMTLGCAFAVLLVLRSLANNEKDADNTETEEDLINDPNYFWYGLNMFNDDD